MGESRKTCFELRAALEQLGIPSAAFARVCGVKPVQVWRWCEGKAPIPVYAWTILSLYMGIDPIAVLFGEQADWHVKPKHVYRNGKTYRVLAKRFHPDVTGRDTTAEMQLINKMRPR